MENAEILLCPVCGLKKPETQFYIKSKLRKACADCTRERWRRAKRRKTLYEQTLCWECKNAFGGCTWAKKFEPVDGWTAIKTNPIRGRNSNSYHVIRCPEFDPDERGGVGE